MRLKKGGWRLRFDIQRCPLDILQRAASPVGISKTFFNKLPKREVMYWPHHLIFIVRLFGVMLIGLWTRTFLDVAQQIRKKHFPTHSQKFRRPFLFTNRCRKTPFQTCQWVHAWPRSEWSFVKAVCWPCMSCGNRDWLFTRLTGVYGSGVSWMNWFRLAGVVSEWILSLSLSSHAQKFVLIVSAARISLWQTGCTRMTFTF